MTAAYATRPDLTPRHDYTFPSPDQWTLGNGVRIVHMPTTGALLSLTLTNRGGADAEDGDAEGVATLVDRVRREGTRRLTGTQFAAALDQIGADFWVNTSVASSTVGMSVPADNLTAAAALLAETATSPLLGSHQVDQQRRLQLEELRQWLAQPARQADLVLDEISFAAADRRSRPLLGTIESIASLTDEAVRHFAHRHLTPENSTLIVAGRCSRADIEGALEGGLADWVATSEAPRAQPERDAVPGASRVLVVDRPDAVQTEIRLGAPSVGRRDPAWASLVIGAHVLGGSINSRLSSVLREEKGYTYGVQAYAGAVSAEAGRFVITTSVDTASTGPASEDLLSVLRETLVGGVTDAECRRAVGEQLGLDALRFQTAGAFARVLHDYVEHDLPLDWLNTRRRALAEVSADSASRALAATVDLDAPHLVFVGDAATIGPALERVFEGSVVTVR